MKYHLYDEHERHQGTFESIEKLRNFLCDRKYDISCDADLSCTFVISNILSGTLTLRSNYVS